jgi:hypothetical protein
VCGDHGLENKYLFYKWLGRPQGADKQANAAVSRTGSFEADAGADDDGGVVASWSELAPATSLRTQGRSRAARSEQGPSAPRPSQVTMSDGGWVVVGGSSSRPDSRANTPNSADGAAAIARLDKRVRELEDETRR